ncbi:MAG: carboxypeptidase-like regulatory domain-containing protein [Bryobacteraceae bacterium]
MKSLLAGTVFLLGCVPLMASIDGTVLNGTTGKTQAAAQVNLMQPGGQGMQVLAKTETDASGHFVFNQARPMGPILLQVRYKGVHYDKLLTPNVSASNVQLEIYEPTKSPAVAQVAQRMLIFDANTSRIGVEEMAIIENQSKQTYNNRSLGALRFFLPPAANGQVRVSVQDASGMPLPRPAEKTATEHVFRVDFPIKPGQTEINVNYTLPVGSPFTYRGRVVGVKGMQAGPLRLVAPLGITLGGSDIQELGIEPTTQAGIYNIKGNGNFSVEITGTGSMRQDANADNSDEPQYIPGKPPIYKHRSLLLGLALTILALGAVVLYRTSPRNSEPRPSGRG